MTTPSGQEAIVTILHVPAELPPRRKHGDWDEPGAEDVQANEDALRHGSWLLSAYRTRLEAKLWVITEWDRSTTTPFLPDEH